VKGAAAIRSRLLAWYASSRRDLPWRRTRDPYRIWVSEVMLQQTRVQTVIPYYQRFVERFPDVASLAAADADAAIKAWEGLGYYARVRNLQRAARAVVERYGGDVPSDPDAFRDLPGVGDYVCAAVQSIAFGRPLAAVDGNVKRVLARLFAIEDPVNRAASARVFQSHADSLLDRRDPAAFNQAMMELGATVCRPTSPRCDECPVRGRCEAARGGAVGRYPVRERKRPVPEYRVAVGVVEDDGRMLITRRPAEGLLGGLWEFPGGKIRDGESAREAAAREIREETGLEVDVTDFVARVRHAYTHFRVELEVYRCRPRGGTGVVLDGPTDYRWIHPEEVARYAFPKANHKFIPFLLDGHPADDE
jgi:A/G-specific adenine glycosylase